MTIYEYTQFFAEFPDENGIMKKHITKTYPCVKFESGTCKGEAHVYGEIFYKLYDEFGFLYFFNDESPIADYGDIHSGETLVKVMMNHTCGIQDDRASDSEGLGFVISASLVVLVIIDYVDYDRQHPINITNPNIKNMSLVQ
ncbi:hypothetical protein U3516DRAFT_749049 [Neocallimastix sp. 'constans']